jgi:ABC-type transport system involved in cytochrome c biogenesis permease subunit
MQYLYKWKKLIELYNAKDQQNFSFYANQLEDFVYKISTKYINKDRIVLENYYGDFNLLHKSLLLYISSFLLYLLSIFFRKYPELITKAATMIFSIGIVTNFLAIAMRVYILARPPVSGLYESIIFVSLIVVCLSVILERKYKIEYAAMTGSLLGALLLFISTKYASDGDTMSILIAVLNSNFWLTVHVLTITSGYALCFISGTVSHIYLIKQNKIDTKNEKHLVILSLISLVFVLTGTLLGGVWADQSWGRFWGWDPKENGAMLIALWLIMLLHGRISKIISPTIFAFGLAFINIIVMVAWFGVNLLSVGLHSYGFTNKIALSLGLFICVELLVIIIIAVLKLKIGKYKCIKKI